MNLLRPLVFSVSNSNPLQRAVNVPAADVKNPTGKSIPYTDEYISGSLFIQPSLIHYHVHPCRNITNRSRSTLSVLISMKHPPSFLVFFPLPQPGVGHRWNLRCRPVASHVDLDHQADPAGLPGDQNRCTQRVRTDRDRLSGVRPGAGVPVLHFRQSTNWRGNWVSFGQHSSEPQPAWWTPHVVGWHRHV